MTYNLAALHNAGVACPAAKGGVACCGTNSTECCNGPNGFRNVSGHNIANGHPNGSCAQYVNWIVDTRLPGDWPPVPAKTDALGLSLPGDGQHTSGYTAVAHIGDGAAIVCYDMMHGGGSQTLMAPGFDAVFCMRVQVGL